MVETDGRDDAVDEFGHGARTLRRHRFFPELLPAVEDRVDEPVADRLRCGQDQVPLGVLAQPRTG